MSTYYGAICDTCKKSFELSNIKMDLYAATLPLKPGSDPFEDPYSRFYWEGLANFINWQLRHRGHKWQVVSDAACMEADESDPWFRFGMYDREEMK